MLWHEHGYISAERKVPVRIKKHQEYLIIMNNKISPLNNLLYALVGTLVSTVVSVLILALAIAIFGWGGYGVVDGVIHYLKYLPDALLWNSGNIVSTALVFPIFSTTLVFAGLAHLIYTADSRSNWSRGLFAIIFFIVVTGFWSNYLYFADYRTWLIISGFVMPYIFVLLVLIAFVIRIVYVKFDVVKGNIMEILAVTTVIALLSGIFELIQLSGFD